MESGQLGGKSATSQHPPKNPCAETSTGDKPCKIREEGELTSSSEEAPPTSPGLPSTGISIAAPSLLSKINATSIVGTESVKSGIRLPGKSQAGCIAIQSRVTTPPVRQKGNSMICNGPIRPKRSVWKASQANNLIISFSDDSGSDSESQRGQKAPAATDANTDMRKTHAPVQAMRLESAQHPLKTDRQLFTKKVSISQAPASSFPVSSAPKTRSVRSSSVEPRYGSIRSNPVGKKLANQDLGPHIAGTSDSKLQDLRQQIATRENELKLKAVLTVQHNKENSDCYRQFSDLNHNITTTRRIRSICADPSLEPKEPVAKRVRPTSLDSGQSYSPPLQDETSLKFIVPSNQIVLKSDANPVATTVHHNQQKENTDSKLLPNSHGVHQQEQHCPSSLTASKSRKEKCSAGNSSLSEGICIPWSIAQMSKPTAAFASVSSDKPLELPFADRLDANDQLHALNQAKPGGNAGNKIDQQDAALRSKECKSDSRMQANPVQGLVSQPGCDATLLSLIETEEMHDKQLEEAQEHRHRCEIEERNALRAYRKAQRALAKANAQCSYFYRMRELFSARVRSIMMEDSSLFLSSSQHEQFGPRWDFSYNVSGENVDPCTTLVDEVHTDLNAGNQIRYDSHVQSAEAETHNRNSPNGRLNLGSESLSEPDTSTSELQPHKEKETLNVLSPLNDPNASSDENEQTLLQEQHSGHSDMKVQKDNCQQRNAETMIDNSASKISISSLEESMKLEAQLRSELFSRLRMSTSLTKSGLSGNSGDRIEKVSEVDSASGKQKTPPSMNEHHDAYVGTVGDDMILAVEKDGIDNNKTRARLLADDAPHSNQKQSCISDFEGSQAPGGTLSKQVEQNSLNYLPDDMAVLEDCRLQSTGGSKYLLTASIFRSTLHQMKISCPILLNHVQNSNQHDSTSCGHNDTRKYDEKVGDWLIRRIDSYTCNAAIDPLWPLCMHELRGKCNDEECPYQHIRDCSSMNSQQHNVTIGTGSQADLTAASQKLRGVNCISSTLTPPAYLVCFNNREVANHHSDPLLSHTFRSCSTGIFSISLAVSSSLLNIISSDELVMHGNHGSIEARASHQKSHYIQNRSDSMSGSNDNTEILERALTILFQDVDRSEGKKKALSMLTRALEDDPTCSHIWVLYLLIYYSDKNTAEDEDFFSCAVKHNEGSYELWLLYINSCRHLKDQHAAYERSISSLCRESPSGNDQQRHSAFILDLFLQMLHSYAISGHAGKAIKRIHGLIIDKEDPGSVLLSDVLQCLVMSDKYVFWVCCVYLVIYRKLPDAVVQMFELEKDISLVDWPRVTINEEQMELVSKLTDKVAQELSIPLADLASVDYETAVEVAQCFALSHVRLVEAIDGLESSRKLLEKYINKYPCLELVLVLAQFHSDDGSGDQTSLSGFEEALTNWPKEVPGVQCIWNQYVEYVLRTEGYDKAKDVMVRWSDSVAKDVSTKNGFAAEIDDDEWNGDIDPRLILSLYPSESRPAAKRDLVFGLLNLSLCQLMQDNVVRAQVAIDEALKYGEGEDLRHCIREHAAFLLNHGIKVGKEVLTSEIMDLLSGYMDSVHLPFKEPLSRKFIQQIQKPGVRKHVEGILCPLSPDCSLLNLILESWFGPSLLPQKFERTKDLVDLVESVLDISPANYPLAISSCKILLQQSKVDGVSTFYWASSILVNTIFGSVPIPPEFVWVEASALLDMLTGKGAGEAVRERFYQKALLVYPFSVRLWKLYVSSLGDDNSRTNVVEAAREKGIEL